MINATNVRPSTDFALLQPTAASGYGPGWRRLQERQQSGFQPARAPAEGQSGLSGISDFDTGDRVFHQKFGNGNIRSVEGDKLNIAFDKAGMKKVVASFVELVRKGG
jgi:DNA helicase-2/ATP-dependent DNA helicase PcrA